MRTGYGHGESKATTCSNVFRPMSIPSTLWGLESEILKSGVWFWVLGFGVQGLEFGGWGLGVGVWGWGLGVW